MKSFIMLLFLVPGVSMAKINDFNALIKENSKAQKKLYKELKGQINEDQAEELAQIETKKKLKSKKRERIVIQDEQSYAAQTNKDLLRFKKEIKSEENNVPKKQKDRLATELKNADKQF